MKTPLVALPIIAVLACSPAFADDTIRTPGDHPNYHVDIEPHGVLGGGFFGSGFFGIGGGLRVSIPLCKNCFVSKINDNVAISFGADIAVYPFADRASPWFLFLPVALQWNFFVARQWSVGAEPGVTPWFDVADNGYCGGRNNCWFIWPALSVVARYHFNEKVALTMRAGFPEFFNIGVSFWL
jgi:hypothetical protein